MTSIMFSVFFLLAAGDPPTETTTQTTPAATATTTAAAPAAEPKMICKYEHVTGSRLSKQKVCRPEGATGNDQSTALQREFDKFGARPERAPGIGS